MDKRVCYPRLVSLKTHFSETSLPIYDEKSFIVSNNKNIFLLGRGTKNFSLCFETKN